MNMMNVKEKKKNTLMNGLALDSAEERTCEQENISEEFIQNEAEIQSGKIQQRL